MEYCLLSVHLLQFVVHNIYYRYYPPHCKHNPTYRSQFMTLIHGVNYAVGRHLKAHSVFIPNFL